MKRGILLLNLGGPERLKDVRPFLYNLFSDPDILVGVPAPFLDAWLAAGGESAGGHTCGQSALLDNDVSGLDERIDYVFVRDADVRGCVTIGDQEGDRTSPGRLWPSDHAGVVARLQF